MIITNKSGLPETLVNAIKQHTHKGGDYSASMLTDPVQLVWLRKRHSNKLEEDAKQRIWSLFGTAIHYVIEQGEADNELVEGYLETEVEGPHGNVVFSGTTDVYSEDGVITDWKTDRIYVVKSNARAKERVVQLNAYGFLFRKHGFKVTKLQTISLCRDWRPAEAKREQDYPDEVVTQEYPLWDMSEAENYFTATINAFESHKNTPDEKLPPCTPEDKWQEPDKWAVMKKGGKRATKKHDTATSASDHAAKLGANYFVEHRPSLPTRCLDYCPVRDYCAQFRREHGNGDSKETK